VVILRAEGGYVIAPDDAGIPEDFLFRAGGTGSVGGVRGYAYQSLGIAQAYGTLSVGAFWQQPALNMCIG
jgi:translocation and assembly module TamA